MSMRFLGVEENQAKLSHSRICLINCSRVLKAHVHPAGIAFEEHFSHIKIPRGKAEIHPIRSLR